MVCFNLILFLINIQYINKNKLQKKETLNDVTPGIDLSDR